MKIAVSSTGDRLDAEVSQVFGRCPYFLVVDTETMVAAPLVNPGMEASGGAGVQAAQLIVRQGAGVVLSGKVGPNAMQILKASGIAFGAVQEGTVLEAVGRFRSGELATTQGGREQ